MGNITKRDVLATLAALEDVLRREGVINKSALDVAMDILAKL